MAQEGQNAGLALENYTKSTPPGWRPGIAGYPFRLYVQRMRLWYRITELSSSACGPAAIGRLSGRPYSLILETLRLTTQEGEVLQGDAALAFEGQAAIAAAPATADTPAVTAQPEVLNGMEAMLQLLAKWYSAPDQSTSQSAIDMFESFERSQGMSLLSYLLEFETRLDMAKTMAGYSINQVALTSKLLKGAHLPRDRKDHILWKVEGDYTKYEEIRQLLMQMAKLSVQPGLPGADGYQSKHSYHTGADWEWEYDTDGNPIYYGNEDWSYDDDEWWYDDDVNSYHAMDEDYGTELYDAEGWPMFQDESGNLCYYQDGDVDSEYQYEDYPDEGEYPYEDAYQANETQSTVDPFFGKGKGKGKRKGKGKGFGSSEPDAHFGKGKGKRKGKGKGFRRKGKGKGKGFRPSKGPGKGKSKKGKGKPAGRSLNMGCSNCGSPNHDTASCPWSQRHVRYAEPHAPHASDSTAASNPTGSGSASSSTPTPTYLAAAQTPAQLLTDLSSIRRSNRGQQPAPASRTLRGAFLSRCLPVAMGAAKQPFPPAASTTFPRAFELEEPPLAAEACGRVPKAATAAASTTFPCGEPPLAADITDQVKGSLLVYGGLRTPQAEPPAVHEEPAEFTFHSVRGQPCWGLIYDPGAPGGLCGTETLRNLMDEVLAPHGHVVELKPQQATYRGISDTGETSRYRAKIPLNLGPLQLTFEADTIGGAGDICPLLWGNNSCREHSNVFLANYFDNGDGMLLFPRHKSGTVGVRLLLTDTGHYLVPIHQPGATTGENTLYYRSDSAEVQRARKVFLCVDLASHDAREQPGGEPESEFMPLDGGSGDRAPTAKTFTKAQALQAEFLRQSTGQVPTTARDSSSPHVGPPTKPKGAGADAPSVAAPLLTPPGLGLNDAQVRQKGAPTGDTKGTPVCQPCMAQVDADEDDDDDDIPASDWATCATCGVVQNANTVLPCTRCAQLVCGKCCTDGICKACMAAGFHAAALPDLSHLQLRCGILSGWHQAENPHASTRMPYPGDMFPDSASPGAVKRSVQIPEEFYNTTGHMVLTPANAARFIEIHAAWMHRRGAPIQWDLWELYSGSGRTSAVAQSQGLSVGPPIDYRYGWDMDNPAHRRLLDRLHQTFRPKVILAAPDCKAWSRSSNTADKAERAKARAAQLDGLDWLQRLCMKQFTSGRGFIVENPFGSDIWRESPLASVEAQFGRQKTHQCRFGANLHGKPIEKATAWVSCIKMKNTALRCMRNHEHGTLQGYDPKTKLPNTALAAVYPRMLCKALIHDVIKFTKSLCTLWSCPVCAAGRLAPPDSVHTHVKGECFMTRSGANWRRAHERALPPSRGRAPRVSAEDYRRIRQDQVPADPAGVDSDPAVGEADAPVVDADDDDIEDSGEARSAMTRFIEEMALRDVSHLALNCAIPGVLQIAEDFLTDHLGPSGDPDEATYLLLQVLDAIKEQCGGAGTRYINVHENESSALSYLAGCLEEVLDADRVAVLTNSFRDLQSEQEEHAMFQGTMVVCQLYQGNEWHLDVVWEDPEKQHDTWDQRMRHLGEHLKSGSEFVLIFANVSGTGAPAVAPPLAITDKDEAEAVTVSSVKTTLQELQQLPADSAELPRKLLWIHEKFWHAPAARLVPLLKAAGLAEDKLAKLPEALSQCRRCQEYKRHLNMPVLKTGIGMAFNEAVQADCSSFMGHTFVLFVDELFRFKLGAVLKDGQTTKHLSDAFMKTWVGIFGPPKKLVCDQGTNLASKEMAEWCDRLNIERILGGAEPNKPGRHSLTGLVEKHIDLVKMTMSKMFADLADSRQEVDVSLLLTEACMGHNTLLTFSGVIPICAVLGQPPRDYTDAASPALTDQDPNSLVERSVLYRQHAKAATLRSVAEWRIAKAAHHHKQQSEKPIKTGDLVDLYRRPATRDIPGWRGPAVVLDVLNATGTAIVKWQNRPYVVSLRHLRHHAGHALALHLVQLQGPSAVFTTERKGLRSLMQLMDYADAEAFGKIFTFGWVYTPETQVWRPERPDHQVMDLAATVAREYLRGFKFEAVKFGTAVRKLPPVPACASGMLICWSRRNRLHYRITEATPSEGINIVRLMPDAASSSFLLFCGWQFVMPDDHKSRTKPPHLGDIPPPYWDDDTSHGGDSGGMDIDDWNPDSSPDDAPNDDWDIDDNMSSDRPPGDVSGPHSEPPDEPPPPARYEQDSSSSKSRSSRNRQKPDPKGTGTGKAAPPTSGSETSRSRSSRNDPKKMHACPKPPTSGSETNRSRSSRDLPVPPKGLSKNPPSVPPKAVPSAQPSSDSSRSRSDKGKPRSGRPGSSTDPKRGGAPPPLPPPAKAPSSASDRSRSDHKATRNLKVPPCPARTAPDGSTRTAPAAPGADPPDPDPVLPLADTGSSTPTAETDLNEEPPTTEEYETDINSLYSSYAPDEPAVTSESLWRIPGPFGQSQTHFFCDIQDGRFYRVDEATDNLSAAEMQQHEAEIMEADLKELSQFLQFDVWKLRRREAGMKPISCTWVRKWKRTVRGKDGNWLRKIKSRICARGFLDPQKAMLSKHSSTATRLSQKLLVSLAALHDWEIESWDVSSAFLQGISFEEITRVAKALGVPAPMVDRYVVIDVPGNVWFHLEKMKFLPQGLSAMQAQQEYVLELKKPMYGLNDAPKLWQLSLRYHLQIVMKARVSHHDENFYYWRSDDGKRLTGACTTHVDDTNNAATPALLALRRALLEKKFGKMSVQTLPFMHVGITYERLQEGGLKLHQKEFAQALKIVKIDRGRKEDSPLDPAETTTLRGALGGLLYLTYTRPDISADVVMLQSKVTKATIADLKQANAIIRRAQQHSGRGLFFRKLQPPLCLMAIADASFSTKNTSYAVEGTLSVLKSAPTGLKPGNQSAKVWSGQCHVLSHHSGKAKRVSHSTSHAETLSAYSTLSTTEQVAERFTELTAPHVPTVDELIQMSSRGSYELPVHHFTDCMDLVELATGIRGCPQDRSQRLIVLSIRERRLLGKTSSTNHLQTQDMVANSLTKHDPSDMQMAQLLSSGHLVFSHATVHRPVTRVTEDYDEADLLHYRDSNSSQ